MCCGVIRQRLHKITILFSLSQVPRRILDVPFAIHRENVIYAARLQTCCVCKRIYISVHRVDCDGNRAIFFSPLRPFSDRKTMAFRPNLARPRVRCFSFFAFTSSPFGYKCLSDSMIGVKAKKERFAFTRKNIEGGAQKSADSIAEDSSTR